MAGEVLRCLYRSERASSRVPDERIDRVAAAVGVGRAESLHPWAARRKRGVEETMSELLALAGINVTVTVAFAAFIWRNQVQGRAAQRRGPRRPEPSNRPSRRICRQPHRGTDGRSVRPRPTLGAARGLDRTRPRRARAILTASRQPYRPCSAASTSPGSGWPDDERGAPAHWRGCREAGALTASVPSP